MSSVPVLIAGGGIGGLAAALGLARKGLEVLVLEQAEELGEIGAGIQIGPNAFHALDYLGVGEAARSRAVYVDRLVLMDSVSDDEITHLPVDAPFRTRFGNPYAVIHRADLYGVLLDGCRSESRIELRTRTRVQRYEQNDSRVTVTSASGERIDGLALVGADGMHSEVRRQLVGDGAPLVWGHTTFRCVIPVERMPGSLRWNAMVIWCGPRIHIVHYPLSGWKVFNLVATVDNGASEAVTGEPAPTDEVAKAFQHIARRPRQIIECGESWKRWVLCDREPVENWTRGRVTLLGDAAHPMLQYFAQGACMALEDAVCLAHEVELHGGDLERAFPGYHQARTVRTARVQMLSRLIGDYIYHPEGAKAAVRNAVMGAKSPADYYDDLQWLYGGTGLDQAG